MQLVPDMLIGPKPTMDPKPTMEQRAIAPPPPGNVPHNRAKHEPYRTKRQPKPDSHPGMWGSSFAGTVGR